MDIQGTAYHSRATACHSGLDPESTSLIRYNCFYNDMDSRQQHSGMTDFPTTLLLRLRREKQIVSKFF